MYLFFRGIFTMALFFPHKIEPRFLNVMISALGSLIRTLLFWPHVLQPHSVIPHFLEMPLAPCLCALAHAFLPLEFLSSHPSCPVKLGITSFLHSFPNSSSFLCNSCFLLCFGVQTPHKHLHIVLIVLAYKVTTEVRSFVRAGNTSFSCIPWLWTVNKNVFDTWMLEWIW